MKSILRTLVAATVFCLIAITYAQAQKETSKISLAEWSLHRSIEAGSVSNLDFPRIAKRTTAWTLWNMSPPSLKGNAKIRPTSLP